MKKLLMVATIVACGMAFAHYDLRKEARINVLHQTHVRQANLLIDAQNANRQLLDELSLAVLREKKLQEQYDALLLDLTRLVSEGMW